MTFQEKKKACLEALVIGGLVVYGIFSGVVNKDYTNAAWALGLAGGYVFKNGYTAVKAANSQK